MKDVTDIHLRLDKYIYIKSHTIILRMFFFFCKNKSFLLVYC